MYSLTFRVRVMLAQQRNPCTDCKSAQQHTTRGMRPRTDRQTHRPTDTHTRIETCVTTIHFASSTTHAKCNEWQYRP